MKAAATTPRRLGCFGQPGRGDESCSSRSTRTTAASSIGVWPAMTEQKSRSLPRASAPPTTHSAPRPTYRSTPRRPPAWTAELPRMTVIPVSPTDFAEVERQLAASAERHREVVASMHESGRPAAGQHVAVKSVARAVQLVSFALKRADAAGVPFERLVELTGWEPDLVREGLAHTEPQPWFMARLAPAAIDARAV